MQRVLELIDTYGLTTDRTVVRHVTAGSQRSAREVLDELRRKRSIFRHGRTGTSTYYTRSPTPLRSRAWRRLHAILAFSMFTRRPRPLLPRPTYQRLAADLSQIVGIKPPKYRPCYQHRLSAAAAPRLSLIRVGRASRLQSVIEELDQFVASPAFRPWYHLALGGGLSLTYLMPASAPQRTELARWLRHRPPISRLGRDAVEVPTYVFEAVRTP